MVVGTIATSMVAGSFLCALLIFMNLPQSQIVHLFSVINLDGLKLSANFQIDALSIWFEEIDKEDWSARIQYYLAEFWAMASPAKKLPTGKTVKMDDEDETEEA